MADQPSILGRLGSGLSQGLGAALTPVAMVMAARRGEDPFAVLRAADEASLQQQLRQQQLQASNLANVGAQAAGVADPAMRQFLGVHPGAAQQFGLETAPASFAAPEYLERAGIGPGMLPTPPGGEIGLLPSQAGTLDEARRQGLIADTDWQNLVTRMATGAMGGGGEAGGGVTEGAAPATGGGLGQYVLGGFTGNQPNFTLREPIQIPAGSTGPGGQQIKGGQPLGTKQAVVTPAKAGQAASEQLKKVRIAREAFKAFVTPINPNTGEPDPKGVVPIDTLYDNPFAAGLRAIPGIGPMALSLPTQYAAGRPGGAGSAVLVAGSGQRANLVKALGDAGNLNTQEQVAAEVSLLPGAGDTATYARYKYQFTDRLLDTIEKGLAAGTMSPDEVKSLLNGAVDHLESVRPEMSQPGATTPTPEGGPPSSLPPAPTAATTPAPPAPGGIDLNAVETARQRLLNTGTRPRVVARAVGGPVSRGQLALVGEQGPELMAGPGTVMPMQMAQAAPVPAQQMRTIGAAPGMGGGTMVPVDPGAVKPPRMIGGTLGAATAKPTPAPSGGMGTGTGLTDADRARLAAEPEKWTVTFGQNGAALIPR